jgi:hypothetical protein
VKEGDFAMIMGYPGSTDRFLSSHGVRLGLEQEFPSRVKIRGKKLDIYKQDMDARTPCASSTPANTRR